MPLNLSWDQIALRLCLTLLAGGLIGLNRGGHGRPAGLRTTILVCLAASVSMIEANLLLGTAGKTVNSFATLDLMRLPLGILTGMGFIGAGAIVRRGNLVTGVTTASTLWFTTVIGLCLGGGQIALGMVSLVLALIVLWCLQWVEKLVKKDRKARFTVISAWDGPSESEIHRVLQEARYEVVASRVLVMNDSQKREAEFEIRWQSASEDRQSPPFVATVARSPGVERVEWHPI